MEELARWVLSVDRRRLVMLRLEGGGVFSAANIAEALGRSVQNINRALHELEDKGLIECLTPEKQTWRRYVLTATGRDVLEELRKGVRAIGH